MSEKPARTDEKQAPGQTVETIHESAVVPAVDPKKRRRRRLKALRSFIIRLVILGAVVYVLLFHIVGLTTMPNGDMSPRLEAGDLLLFYRIERTPKAQDVIVIDKTVKAQAAGETESESTKPHRFVCRVIACPGDTVEITPEQGLKVNGSSQAEQKIYSPTYPYEGDVEYPITLADGEWFVLSDYRNGGADSRFFGPVKQEEIQGVVITLLRRNGL